jgi:L-amino acid N-acyltransferase YncA
MAVSPALQTYLDAVKHGYDIVTEAVERADDLGIQISRQLRNEVTIGRYEAQELAAAVAADPEEVLSPDYRALTEAAIATQSRALAFVEMAYLQAAATSDESRAIAERLADANRRAAEAAATLSPPLANLWEIVEQAGAQQQAALDLPAQITLGGTALTLRQLGAADGSAVVAFGQSLPDHDLLFLRRDITQPDQVEAWIRDAEHGLSSTVMAFSGSELVGYATVVSDGLNWTRHMRELRVLVSPAMRGKRLGRLLTEQAFAAAREQGVTKMIAQMTTDQEAAIAIFGSMGFEREAILHDHVIDRAGTLHDLQIMSLNVEDFQAKLAAVITEP